MCPFKPYCFSRASFSCSPLAQSGMFCCFLSLFSESVSLFPSSEESSLRNCDYKDKTPEQKLPDVNHIFLSWRLLSDIIRRLYGSRYFLNLWFYYRIGRDIGRGRNCWCRSRWFGQRGDLIALSCFFLRF